MAESGSSNQSFEHGNPAIFLPASLPAGRLTIGSDDRQPIWISHQLPGRADVVRVNVWEGHFVGTATGWAVLAAGQYSISWKPPDRDSQFLGFIQIIPRRVFESLGQDASDDATSWLSSPLPRADAQRYRFREGAMHGVLAAEFHSTGPISQQHRWGLIARHYNAFHHMRVSCRMQPDGCVIELLRYANTPTDQQSSTVVARATVAARTLFPMTLSWWFNGAAHVIAVNGQTVMQAHDDYMGGVEIVGIIDHTDSVACARTTLDTTQAVQRHVITRPQYEAEIRPGNVDRLFLRQSASPDQNLAWESGIQFGHIGGSEIKFTQGATLHMIDDGPVAASVAWSGPCPKFVDQAEDVRGRADGFATFFHDHFVIADNVLTWTNRSVGPDIDLLGRLLEGPARLALAGQEYFQDWPLRAEGEMSIIQVPQQRATYPAALAIPLRLGRELWWLKVLILLRSPDPHITPAGIFSWQCPHGLTASHDFRCTPTTPGQEYAFTIAVSWQRSDTSDPVEHALSRWRNQWIHPMQIQTSDGMSPFTVAALDGPREAMNFSGCFDRSRGVYVINPGAYDFLRLDPLQIARNQPVLLFRQPMAASVLRCSLDDVNLQRDTQFTWQRTQSGDMLLQLLTTVTKPVTLNVRFEPEGVNKQARD